MARRRWTSALAARQGRLYLSQIQRAWRETPSAEGYRRIALEALSPLLARWPGAAMGGLTGARGDKCFKIPLRQLRPLSRLGRPLATTRLREASTYPRATIWPNCALTSSNSVGP